MDDTRRAERGDRPGYFNWRRWVVVVNPGYGPDREEGVDERRRCSVLVVCSCLGERVGGGGGGREYVSLCLSGCFGERDWKFGDAAFKAHP